MSTKEPASSSPAASSSATKPSPTAGTKPNRLPAPALFVGPPSRNASQLSVSRQGIETGGKTRDPLTRQRTNHARSTTAETSDGKDGNINTTTLPTLRKASEKDADARWREMQSTLNEVELTAQSSTHVFGARHAAALDDLRRAQVALAQAWGRGNEDKASRAAADERAQEVSMDRFGNAEDIAQDRRDTHGARRRGDTTTSMSTTLSDESVVSDSTAGGGGGGGESAEPGMGRRGANEAYFKKVEEGVKDVVAKLEVVAEAMKGVEGESRSLWSGTASERSSGSEGSRVASGDGQKAGVYEKFGVSLLMVLALEMWTMDVGVVLGYGVLTMDEKQLEPSASPPEDVVQVASTYIKPQARKLHDPAVFFEEYHYYALKTREEERSVQAPKTNWRELLLRKKPANELTPDSNGANSDEEKHRGVSTTGNVNLADRQARLEVSDQEWTDASRAFRTASWGACWYLITTDILGPYGVGFAMGTLGWGPGIVLYTVFGFFAGYGGYLLWHAFLGLDSHEFPLKNYGDLFFRLNGSTARYIVNVLQSLALILILGQITIQQGQALSQVSKFKLCYAVCPIIFICVGFFLGQIRTLRSYGWVANLAVWLNLLVIFISMGAFANSPPNFAISILGSSGGVVDPTSITPDADGNYPPIIHYSGMPPSGSFIAALNGLLSGVFAYGGAQLFVEFMAEMKRPRDFLKAMWGAQFFIWAVYLIYGCFTYYFQGQYSYQISYQGVSAYGLQTAGNMIGIFSGLIAAGLYSNIGIKVLYNNVLMDVFKAPPLNTRTGKILWVIIVPIWWVIGYVIAAGIPDYFGFVSVVSAATVMQFTYSFPPMVALAYDMRLNIMKDTVGEGFNPVTGEVTRKYSGISYWVRGFFSGGVWQIVMNVLHLLYALGAWVVTGLGMYAAVMGMIEAFKIPQLNNFGCTSPLDLGTS
ncbi:hypothetical protein B0A55_10229 [Friedmanniomyces simplex]|uniref:Amino acid transporter transmembrane domain-containing protein n=1 Tax=Friedmanniomyces simplex TaxID=329884 RepID=A0A4U0WTX7_9PEZI|nr:hypothetical protein B0A55_10229 [Friedmanniomyces simplex]